MGLAQASVRAVFQRAQSVLAKALQPLVARLAADPIAAAQPRDISAAPANQSSMNFFHSSTGPLAFHVIS